MPFDSIEAPGNNDSATYSNPNQIINHLLIIWVIDYVMNLPGPFSKPGDPADLVIVDVVDLDMLDPESAQPGLLTRKNWWRQARLIRDLKNKAGNPNPKLAWMTLAAGTAGRQPYQLQDATQHPEAVARAQAWVDRHPTFTPSVPSSGMYSNNQVTSPPPQQQRYTPPPQQYQPPAPVVQSPPPSQLEQMAHRAHQAPPPPPPPVPQPVAPTQQGDIPF